MNRILVLHDDASVRERLVSILSAKGYGVESFASIEETQGIDVRSFDIHLCGQMGKYSDGLIFALDSADNGIKVAIISEKKKFNKFPLIHTGSLSDNSVVDEVEKLLVGS